MRRAHLALAAAALAVPVHAVAAPPPVEPLLPPSPAVEQVAPGIGYQRIVDPGPQVIHVIKAQPSGLVSLSPILTGGATSRRGNLADALAARSPSGGVVAVNGDFFNTSASYPSGITVTAADGLASEPEPTRSALVLGPDGVLAAARLTLTGRWQTTDTTGNPLGLLRTFSGINRPAERTSETVLFTPAYGSATPSGTRRTEAVVTLDGGAQLVPNTSVAGTVTKVRTSGGTAIARGTVVVSGTGGNAGVVGKDLVAGARVRIDPGVAGFPASALALGGGPLLVDAGAPVPAAGEGFSSSQLTQRTARTAIGQTADGAYLLVAAEGPQQGSRGITVGEQARLMARLGARLAVAMDAGGSAQMVVDGSPAVRWSSPRSLTTSLVMRYDGVRVAPMLARITPNGDGIDDRGAARVTAPRPGRLVVVLERRGGGDRRELLSQPVEAGPVVLPVDATGLPLGDGAWDLTATLTPDGLPATTASRGFLVDRTLADLRVRPVRERAGRKVRPAVRIAFRLLRPAKVTVRVFDANGRLRRTLRASRTYRKGTALVVWDRRVSRKLAVGEHRIEVEARTSFGRPGLATDVTLAPVRPPKKKKAGTGG